MNEHVRELLKRTAVQSAELKAMDAKGFGIANSNYLDACISQLRLPVIRWQLEADLDASYYIPNQPQRKLS